MKLVLGFLLLSASLAAGQRRSDLPQVFINHAFVIPDAATYEELRNSTFLRQEFGLNEERTTQRTDRSYTGLYFYGLNTYFEFLKPDDARAVGGSALALGVDKTGGIEQLAAALKQSGFKAETEPITRQGAEGQAPWFTQLRTSHPEGSGFGIWVLEYDPRFLTSWYPEAGGPKGGIRRADILSRYAARIAPGKDRSEFLMQDIVEVEFALPPEALGRAQAECRELGLRVHKVGKELSCLGDALRLRMVPGSTPGIRALKFKLNRLKEGDQVYRFGSTELRFEGDTATWRF